MLRKTYCGIVFVLCCLEKIPVEDAGVKFRKPIDGGDLPQQKVEHAIVRP